MAHAQAALVGILVTSLAVGLVCCSSFETSPDPAPMDAPETGVARDGSIADGPPYVGTGIYCAGDNCDPATSVCCSVTCIANTRSCEDRATVDVSCPESCNEYATCDDAFDCERGDAGGTVCCGVEDKESSARCQRLTDCQKTPHTIYCDPEAPEPCLQGAVCTRRDGGLPTCVGL